MTLRSLRLPGSASQVVAVTLGILIVQLFGGIILARTLGPADRGVLAALVLWAGIASDIGGVGTPPAVSYWAASGSPWAGLRYLKRAFPMMALVGLGIYGALIVLSGRLAVLPTVGILVMGVWTVGQLLHLPVLRFQQGMGHMSRFDGLRIIAGIGPALGYAVFALFGLLTVTTGSLSITTFMLAAMTVGVVLIRKHGPPRKGSPAPDGDRRSFWSYSGRSWLSILAARGNRTIDLFVLTLVAASAADIGLYAVAATAALVLSVVGGSLGLDLFPKIASTKDGNDVRPILRKFISASAAFSLVAALGFFVLAGWLIPLVYGAEFTGSVGPARVLVFGAVARSISRVAGQGLAGLGHPGRVAFAQFAGAFVTLVGALYAVNRSLTMVAAAASIGYVVTMVLVLVFTWTSAHRKYA